MPQLYKQIQISPHRVSLDKPPVTHPAEPPNAQEIPWNLFHIFTMILSTSAQQSGQQAGYEQGFTEGQQQAMEQTHTLKQTLEALLKSIPDAIVQNRLALKEEIADIVCIIIQQLFLQQPPDPGMLQKKINTLLTELNHQQTIKIHLHPDDIDLLQNGTIQLHAHPLHHLEIVAQTTLLAGGCIIHSEHGMLDASLESQIQRFQEILIQIRQEKQHASLA